MTASATEIARRIAQERGSEPALDAGTDRAVRAFLRRLADRYAVKEAYLYGSRALGTHRPDSDADIAVVLRDDGGDLWAAITDMAGIAFDVLLETGVLIEALPLRDGDLSRPETFSNPALLHAIRRDGRPL